VRAPMPASPPTPARGRGAPEPEFVLAGRAFRGGRLQPVEVGFGERGEIVAVGRSLPGRHRRDLGEAVLIPSATDLHVHFRDPGPDPSLENFSTGTLQAVLGGVGTVGDMPNTDPPTTSVDRLESKIARVRGRAACDVVLYAAATGPAQVRRVGTLAGALKLYGSPTTGIEDPVPLSEWPMLLAAARGTDLPVTVHAEDPGRFDGPADRATDLEGWNAHRDGAAELAAVDALLRSAGTTRLHIAHVTSATVADAVRAAGHSCEATPQHLLLSASNPRLGGLGKVNPPLRSGAERRGLFEAFRTQRIPILASDHAPHPLDQKTGSFAEAAAGMPGVETMLPLFLALVAKGELDLGTFQSASADRPARWLGLRTGRLLPGHRGHVYAVDFRRTVRLRARDLHAPCGWTAFEGREAIFPRDHYLDGRPVVRDGEYVGTPTGRAVRPEFARSTARA
jgi:dihydroorotase